MFDLTTFKITSSTILLLTVFNMTDVQAQITDTKSISKKGMDVSWQYLGERIHFWVSAPSTGWLAIGLNDKKDITGATLYMGSINNTELDISEHYTIAPGNYKSYKQLDFPTQVLAIEGTEKKGQSSIHFSVPTKAFNKYHKNLQEGKTYYMTLAYSRVDDYQHHSMMRTIVQIKL